MHNATDQFLGDRDVLDTEYSATWQESHGGSNTIQDLAQGNDLETDGLRVEESYDYYHGKLDANEDLESEPEDGKTGIQQKSRIMDMIALLPLMQTQILGVRVT
jgi:hypothetical protein